MNSETRHVFKLARKAVVDLYIGGGNGRFIWPYRLQPISDSTPSVRRASFKYILDSGFVNDGSVTTEAILDEAEKRDPDYVIPNDTVNNSETDTEHAIKQTAQKTDELLDRIQWRDIGSEVLIPLQPPYPRHYQYLRDEYPRQAYASAFALGGLLNRPPAEQEEHIRQFRAAVGWDVYAHGFGLGASREIILTLRETPSLLDSLDVSTPQQNALSGCIAGNSRVPVYFGPASGTDVSTPAGKAVTAELTNLARMLAPSITSQSDLEVDWDKFQTDPPKTKIATEYGATTETER